MKIIFATGNPHKLDEIKKIANSDDIEFLMPPTGFNPVEDGETFEENSYIKALEAYKLTGILSLADDSGLCVNALNGAPGLYSARYAGTQDEKITKLLNELEGKADRTAKFVCYMTLIDSKNRILHIEEGECKGRIIKEAKGVNGFGYDPIFQPDGYDMTFAELPDNVKNSVSHRAVALKKMLNYIKNNL